jgi:hypothetical protein
MKEENNTPSEVENPPSVEEIEQKLRSHFEEVVKFCKEGGEAKDFYSVEKSLMELVSQLGCLFFQLFLTAFGERLDCSKWLDSGLYYVKKTPIARSIKTIYGKVRYWRTYLVRKGKRGGGFYPLDTVLGITRDGFSPFVIGLAAKLATRVSFPTAVILFRSFCGWSPSSESIEHLVLGIGRDASAYMEVVAPPQNDGEILIIQSDGKATPTATEKELSKRRGKRKKKKNGCNCQHCRGKAKRKRCKRNRRKNGDKSKNGRSTTIIVMYTLRRGSDGLLHGPINKVVWASYAPRKVMFAWARRQATKRGFPPDTDKRIHIAVDGEKCLKDGLSNLFPEASFVLDIRHVEEKLWKIGRAFYEKGSKELENWVEGKRTFLYEGSVSDLVSELKDLKKTLSTRARRDKHKRETLQEVIQYMESRLDMMNYKEYIKEDLPIATGVVEGAARYVVGDRMDCSGMRWIPGRAEALLHLRCIELNGEWDQFYEWVHRRWKDKLREKQKVIVRTDKPIDLLPSSTIDILDDVSKAA